MATNSDYLSEFILNFVNSECTNNLQEGFKEFIDASTFTSFDSACRFCLSSGLDVELEKIFNENLPISDMIHSFTSVKLSANDEFPKNICITCISKLKKCIAFKNQVESVDIILHQFITENPQEIQICSPRNGTEFLKCCFEQCEKDLPMSTKVYTPENVFCEVSDQCITIDVGTKEKLDCCKISPLLTESSENHYEVEMNGENLFPETTAGASQNNLEEEYDLKSLLQPLPKKEKFFRCSLCPRAFSNESILNDHMACHSTQAKSHLNSFICAKCDDVFAVEQDLGIHISLHTPETQEGIAFKCNGCEKDFGNLKKLKRHIPTHFVDKPFKCKECNRGFSEMASLTRHYRRHTNNKRERKHRCSECDKCYTDAYDLKVHQRTHSGEKPWKCNDCGKCFKDCRLLNSHRKIHATTKMYACEECGKRFTHYSNLRTHHRIHTGQKPYTCDVCSKSFTQSSNMVLHMRTHNGQRPHKCVECPRSFASSSTLRGHLKWHNFSALRKLNSQDSSASETVKSVINTNSEPCINHVYENLNDETKTEL